MSPHSARAKGWSKRRRRRRRRSVIRKLIRYIRIRISIRIRRRNREIFFRFIRFGRRLFRFFSWSRKLIPNDQRSARGRIEASRLVDAGVPEALIVDDHKSGAIMPVHVFDMELELHVQRINALLVMTQVRDILLRRMSFGYFADSRL